MQTAADEPDTAADAPAPEPAADDDAALVALCRAGRPEGWRRLVARYQRLVYAVARRGGLDDHGAADVFQTVFTRLHEHLPRIREADRLHAWIVTTAKRETIAMRRRADRHVSIDGDAGEIDSDGPPPDEPPSEDPLPEALLSDLQQLHRVRLALERIDERCRTLLALLFADEDERLPYPELAAKVGMPVGSLGPTRGRCLQKLRAAWEALERGALPDVSGAGAGPLSTRRSTAPGRPR
jgi:RNA polymerase sigma factor (sigma-70 family)